MYVGKNLRKGRTGEYTGWGLEAVLKLQHKFRNEFACQRKRIFPSGHRDKKSQRRGCVSHGEMRRDMISIIGEEPKGVKTQQFTQYPTDSITGRYYREKSDLR